MLPICHVLSPNGGCTCHIFQYLPVLFQTSNLICESFFTVKAEKESDTNLLLLFRLLKWCAKEIRTIKLRRNENNKDNKNKNSKETLLIPWIIPFCLLAKSDVLRKCQCPVWEAEDFYLFRAFLWFLFCFVFCFQKVQLMGMWPWEE